jgi:hypothetical protein
MLPTGFVINLLTSGMYVYKVTVYKFCRVTFVQTCGYILPRSAEGHRRLFIRCMSVLTVQLVNIIWTCSLLQISGIYRSFFSEFNPTHLITHFKFRWTQITLVGII